MRKLILSLVVSLTTLSCTKLDNARYHGGSYETQLPTNTKVLSASWKESVLWVTVEDTITKKQFMYEISSNGRSGRINFIK